MGGNHFQISPKFFPEIFYEYIMFVMEPPFGVSGCHIWGGYGGGRGSLCHVPQGRGVKYGRRGWYG
jgi:hypothetical protein